MGISTIQGGFEQIGYPFYSKRRRKMVEVSVIIPTYNRKYSLKKTLESLFNQNYPKGRYEIIVCDDGSTDRTEEMIKRLTKESPCSLKYFKQKKKRSPASARNLGISNSNGRIIGFTDDDCIAERNWIKNAVSYFDGEIGGVVGCTLPFENYDRNPFKPLHSIEITEEDGSYATCNIFYKKSTLTRVGGFDTRFEMGAAEDIDLGLRVKKLKKIIFAKDVVVYHEVSYRSFKGYLNNMKRYQWYALLHKKHPELKKTLFVFKNERHIYPLFIFLTPLAYFLNDFLFLIFSSLSILGYLWAYVIVP
jgi:glycosyltransferase involved in cell wall biosynthesis